MRAKFGRGAVRRPFRKTHTNERMTRTNAHTRVRTTSNNPLNPHGVGWVNLYLSAHACQIWARCSPTAMSKKAHERTNDTNERTHTCTNERHQITPMGWGGSILSIRTCVPNLGAVQSDGRVEKRTRTNERTTRTNAHTRIRTTSNNPLNPHGVGWVNFF